MPYTITTETQEPVENRAKLRAMLRGFRNTCPNCGEGKLFGKWDFSFLVHSYFVLI